MAEVAERLSSALVEPEAFSESTYLGSVTNILHEVLPQSAAQKQSTPERDVVQWVRFESADVSDIRLLMTEEGDLLADVSAPQLLSIGYSVGYQVWLLLANGRAQQVVCDTSSVVGMLRILGTPPADAGDQYASVRPIMAVVGEPLRGDERQAPATVLSFRSMKTGNHCRQQTFFKNDILDIHSSPKVVVVATKQKISVLSASTLEGQAVIRDCFVPESLMVNPFAVGDNWLAYQSHKLVQDCASHGRLSPLQEDTYAATMLSAAKAGAARLGQGVSILGEAVSRLTGGRQGPVASHGVPSSLNQETTVPSELPGVVTVLDVQSIGRHHAASKKLVKFSVSDGCESAVQIVAHFVAHREPIVHMMFDRSGCLLLTCGESGRNFHLFRVSPHSSGSVLSAVNHLYTLHRGDTEATVCHSAFSHDSRWLAVSTLRGTTHVFAITPYGGPVEVRTHTPNRMVNKMSRYHTSAGLEDARAVNFDTSSSSALASSPPGGRATVGGESGSAAVSMETSGSSFSNCVPQLSGNGGVLANKRHTMACAKVTSLQPLSQIKHYSLLGSAGYGSGSSLVSTATGLANTIGYYANQATSQASRMQPGPVSAASSSSSQLSSDAMGHQCVASVFAMPRFSRFTNASVHKTRRAATQSSGASCTESLFIMTSDSRLMEHRLEPHARLGTTGQYAALDVTQTPLASWNLQRYLPCPEVRLPLPSNSALIRGSKLAAKNTASTAMWRAFGCNGLASESSGGGRRGSSSDSSPSVSGRSHARPIPSSSSAKQIQPGDSSLVTMSSSPPLTNGISTPLGVASGNGGGRTGSLGRWLQHVETSTHAEPHRRLWMGPQFDFRKICTKAPSSQLGSSPASLRSADSYPSAAMLPLDDAVAMTSPRIVQRTMPLSMASRRDASHHSLENTVEVYGSWPEIEPVSGRSTDSQSLSSREVEMGLLDAMRESSLAEDSGVGGGGAGSVAAGAAGAGMHFDMAMVATVPVHGSEMSPEHLIMVDQSGADDDVY